MKTTGKYVLYGHEAVPCDDLDEWARRCFESGQSRIVKQETLEDGTWVSTVFLGMDYAFGGGSPLLFETMTRTSSGEWDRQERCSTWKEAEAQHAAMVKEIQGSK